MAGALAEAFVNGSLIAIISWLTGTGSPVTAWLANLSKAAVFVVPFGITAASATLLYRAEGIFGILALVLPIAMVQASMVALSRSAYAHAQAEEARVREREVLLRQRAEASQRAADASERERRKLAADLHDGVIQDMEGLAIRLGAAAVRLGDDQDRLRHQLQESIETTHRVNRDLRSMVIELAPPELAKHGLREALAELLRRLERQGIQGHLDCEELEVDPARLRLVHRVVQEAMRNAIAHAKCRNLWVSVRFEGAALRASVHDDGRGFTAEERALRQQEEHNGLGLLELTARDGGGVLTITSEPGAGTWVELFAPPSGDAEGPADTAVTATEPTSRPQAPPRPRASRRPPARRPSVPAPARVRPPAA